MRNPSGTKKELIEEISALKQRIHALEQSSSELNKISKTLSEYIQHSDNIFDAMDNSVCIIDPDGRIIMCNRSTEKLFNKSPKELKNHFCFEVVHGTLKPPPDCPFLRMKETKHKEYTVVQSDGRWLEITVDPILDDSKRIVAAVHIITDITNRKQTEEELRKNEHKLKSIFRAAPVGIGVVSDRVIIEANDRLCAMTGYKHEELIGKSARMLYPDDETFNIVGSEKYRQIAETGTGVVETRWLTKNGNIIHVLLSSTPFDPSNLSLGVTFTALDISNRKLAENALQESEMLQRTLLTNLSAGVMIVDPVTRIIENVNKTAAVMFGARPDAIVGQRCHLFLCPASEGSCPVCDLGKEVDNSEREMICADGSRRPVLKSVKRIHVKGQEKLLECFVDITDRKQAEEALRESEKRFRSLTEAASDWIWEINNDGLYTYSSPKVKDLLGYEPEDVIGKTPFDFMPRDEAERIIASFKKIKESCRPFSGLENINLHKDGREMVLETNGVPIVDDQGNMLGYRGIDRNITDRKRSEAEKTRLESQLFQSQKMEAVGTLAGGIAHDFNNILTALAGYAGLLRMKTTDTTSLKYVDQILSASQKATDLIQSLLAFSKQQAIDLKPTSINNVIMGTEKLLKRLVTEDITIRTSLTQEDIAVMADATRIDQILFNLATNARDAMPKGGTLTIETKAVVLNDEFKRFHGYGEPGSYALLSISDTGSGMDEATRKKIFDPFFTTKEVGKGTGLGLSTVYGIVKQHKGYINADSKPGAGTTFRIYLPAANAVVNECALTPVTVQGGNETILIAEDNDGARDLIKTVLTEYGYSIIEAIDGKEAIDRFAGREGIDLIILDTVMPKKNGREVYDEIIRKKPGIKVLFTSGYTRDVSLDKGIEHKKVNFIQKPILPDVLLQMVREVLDSKQEN
jgi:two-component system, cell cycle sensor histidine kinase and response regulator CckA